MEKKGREAAIQHCINNFIHAGKCKDDGNCLNPSCSKMKRVIAHTRQCTLLVLIDFCPVQSELFTWSSVTKTFDILPEIIMEYQIFVGLTLPHFEFLSLYLDMFDQN